MALAHGLIAAERPTEAASLLLKNRRRFKQDLTLCNELAEAYAASHQKDFAYFTEAQCQLLRGQRKLALRQFKLAKVLAKKSPIDSPY